MWMDSQYKSHLVHLKPMLEVSIDPVCVVNTEGEIVYMDLAMKGLLGLKGRELRKRMVFCDLLKLPICSQTCQIEKVIKKGGPVRFDEIPASRGSKKLRVSLKASSLRDSRGKTLGAIISVRDTSGEIVLQGKYHKLLDLQKAQEQELRELRGKVDGLYSSLRRARSVRNNE